jgi:hypothetical protein
MGEEMKVEAVEIPPLPEVVEVSIPLVSPDEGDLQMLGGDVEVLGGDVGAVAVSGLDLSERLEQLPDLTVANISSVVNPGAMWTVHGVAEEGDDVEVSIGRRGNLETSFSLPRGRLGDLRAGSFIAAPSESLYETSRLFGLAKTKVEFRPDPGTDPTESDIWLPILRLHCPDHEGCEAEYAIAQANGAAVSLELSVFGLGGGAGQSVTATVSETYSTTGRCMEIAVPAKLVLQLGGTYVNGTQVAYGIRASIKDVDTKALTERPIPPGHGCGRPFAEVGKESLWQLDRRQAGGGGNQTWEVKLETETEGKLSLGLELGTAPLKLGLDYVRKTTSETAITTGVSPGARYAAYLPPGGGDFEVLWTA